MKTEIAQLIYSYRQRGQGLEKTVDDILNLVNANAVQSSCLEKAEYVDLKIDDVICLKHSVDDSTTYIYKILDKNDSFITIMNLSEEKTTIYKETIRIYKLFTINLDWKNSIKNINE